MDAETVVYYFSTCVLVIAIVAACLSFLKPPVIRVQGEPQEGKQRAR